MLVPVIPFFFLFGAIGLHRLRTWARPSVPALDRLVPVLVVSLILAQLWGSVSLGALNSDYSPVWAERVRLAEWVRTHTDPQDLVLTDFPAQLYLLSGRKADFLLSRRGKDKQGFRTLAQLFQYIDDTKAKYLVDDGSVGRLKALKRELFAHVEQPDSGWRVVSRGRLGAIYVRSDTRTTPQPGE